MNTQQHKSLVRILWCRPISSPSINPYKMIILWNYLNHFIWCQKIISDKQHYNVYNCGFVNEDLSLSSSNKQTNKWIINMTKCTTIKTKYGVRVRKRAFFWKETTSSLLLSWNKHPPILSSLVLSCLLLASLDFDESNQKVIFGIDNSSRFIIKTRWEFKTLSTFLLKINLTESSISKSKQKMIMHLSLQPEELDLKDYTFAHVIKYFW